MHRAWGLTLLLFLTGVLIDGPVRAQSGGGSAAAKREAQAAAQEWLELFDEEDFEESWEEAANPFRERIERDGWVRASRRLADSIGTPEARTLAAVQYRDSLRRAETGGPFVVLRYRSTFAEGRYEEMLLLAREEEAWRVAGYRVRPLRAADPSPSFLPSNESP